MINTKSRLRYSIGLNGLEWSIQGKVRVLKVILCKHEVLVGIMGVFELNSTHYLIG
jgi:hypothetical protein